VIAFVADHRGEMKIILVNSTINLRPMKKILIPFFCVTMLSGCFKNSVQQDTPSVQNLSGVRWTEEKAKAWYAEKGWLVGSNFSPSTAINQLEMWQAETFDTVTIDRELAWAEDLGFNSMRVFLHDIVWQQDSTAFKSRMDRFLSIADRHRIGVMFVIFDGVWDPFPKAGKQRDPKPHLHNSGWVQSPGIEILKDTAMHNQLRVYVKGVIRHFATDPRVHAWDLFNEPDNINDPAYLQFEPANKGELSLELLRKTFKWAREVNPSQPLTVAPWKGDWSDTSRMTALDKFMFTQSDVITFHNYDGEEVMERRIRELQVFNRPLICTEYMARGNKSTFEEVMPVLKKHNVGAYNWGFVAGKTQTIYPWDSWRKQYTAEPTLWFHDIFRSNGEPYREEEVKLIRQLTEKK
jgi:hypothetical protein